VSPGGTAALLGGRLYDLPNTDHYSPAEWRLLNHVRRACEVYDDDVPGLKASRVVAAKRHILAAAAELLK
jgi:hypothetical protein